MEMLNVGVQDEDDCGNGEIEVVSKGCLGRVSRKKRPRTEH